LDELFQEVPKPRLKELLQHLDLSASSWHRTSAAKKEAKKRPGPKPQVSLALISWVELIALENPWYGYHKLAILCRRSEIKVSDRQVYRILKDKKLLKKKRKRKAEEYPSARLFELLPQGVNQLWQMDVTYVHIPGFGWWYAVTLIDYFSRYLLAIRLCDSFRAEEINEALSEGRREAERIHGSLGAIPFLVTDNGSSFLAKKFREFIEGD